MLVWNSPNATRTDDAVPDSFILDLPTSKNQGSNYAIIR